MRQYVVDAFSDKVFSGNPAAVCVTNTWLSDELMMNITRENNLSETAFAVKEGESYKLRWFTPACEIDLCGHATLATAYIIMNYIEKGLEKISFQTMSGELIVEKNGDMYEMDFPAYELKSVEVTPQMVQAMGATPIEVYMGRDLLCIFDDENTVINMTPDMEKLKQLPGRLQHVTARGSKVDCVSRSFAPALAVGEDPVCGSGHCHIAPYWFDKLKKTDIVAYQASSRGGTLYCSMQGERVKLCGNAALYSVADINIGI